MAVIGLRREMGVDGGRRGMREVSWMNTAPVQAKIMLCELVPAVHQRD